MIFWIIFGAITGWITGILTGSSGRQGCILNIIIGIVGAFIGGTLMRFLTNQPFNFGFDLQSFVVAVIGALILVALTGAARRGNR